MAIKNNTKAVQLLDESIKDCQKPEDVVGENGLLTLTPYRSASPAPWSCGRGSWRPVRPNRLEAP